MAAHAKLSASGAHRWATCPASISMEDGIPENNSSFAQEGTDAHDLAEQCLRDKANADAYLNEVIGTTLVDSEMVDAVQMYLDYVRNYEGSLFVEQRVDFSPWVPEGFGTADAIVIDGRTLSVIDLKYGKGIKVDAEENLQAVLYALGVYNDFSFLEDFQTIKMVIVQPRLDHISEWEISVKELMVWAEYLQSAANDALSEDASFKPGEKQCRFCKAKGNCRALADHNLNTAKAGFEDLSCPVPPTKLNNEEIAKLLPQLDLFSDWVKAVQAHAYYELQRGCDVPGYKLVEGRSIRKWIDSDGAEKALRRSKLKVGEIFTKKLISPTQAEKLLGKGHPLLDKQAIKPEGKPTIAVNSDKRPALDIDPAEGFPVIH